MNGVKYAVPLYSGVALVKLHDGTYQPSTVLGLDDTSLVGRPELIQGKIEDIFADDGFIVVKDDEFHKLQNPTLGTTFEINDHRAVVIGIAKVTSSTLFGIPTLYTTFTRAFNTSPPPVSPLPTFWWSLKVSRTSPKLRRRWPRPVIRPGPMRNSSSWSPPITNTRPAWAPTSSSWPPPVSWWACPSAARPSIPSCLENLAKFGALKAIGAKSYELVAMILFQTLFTGLTGYGLGVGLSSLLIGLAKSLPNYAADVTYFNLGLAFVMVLIISGVSSFIAVRKVIRVEPFDIFRG
jgi:putative ABC transport system permease protein